MLKFPGDGDNGDVVWIYKGDIFRPAAKLNTVLLLDQGGTVDIVHRECHGFVNLCRSTLPVHTGMGTGWGLVTLTQPAPVVRAPSGHSGFCT